jgi:hypothetical protein
MATIWNPDQTFYPSPKMAMSAPREKLAYVVVLNPKSNGGSRPDALAVMDVDPDSSTYLDVVGRVEFGVGDEVHHFGWNACSAALRLERLLGGPLSLRPAPARRAQVPARPRPEILPDLRRGHEG